MNMKKLQRLFLEIGLLQILFFVTPWDNMKSSDWLFWFMGTVSFIVYGALNEN